MKVFHLDTQSLLWAMRRAGLNPTEPEMMVRIDHCDDDDDDDDDDDAIVIQPLLTIGLITLLLTFS